ncbi:TPA: hypothetical protein ACH3X1_012957 [Trebouxia sp. C0004]
MSQLNGKGPASVTSEDSSSSHAPHAVEQEVRHEPSKAKKPKAKRPKVTPSQAASGLDSTQFAALLASVQHTYRDNQLSQLQTVGDHLLTAFQTSELPFNKMLNEQPLEKVTDVPLQDLPQEVKHILEKYAVQLDVHVVSQFIQHILEAVLETVPLDGNLKHGIPKAKVGLLIFLSLLLRAVPAALLLRSQALLLGGKIYSGPGRLHLLLWLINQTVRCNPAMGVAIWLRVLLPQILGMQLPSVMQKTAPAAEPAVLVMASQGISTALDYLDGLLRSTHEPPLQQHTNDHGFPEWHGGSANLGASNSVLHRLSVIGLRYPEPDKTHMVEAVVPPAALEAIIRSQFSESSHLKIAYRIRLLKQYEVLRELAFAGAKQGGFSCEESIRLALDTAVMSEGPYEGSADESVDQAARNMLCCIACDSQAATVWESRHKQQLKGSTRVLQHLLHVYPRHFQPIQTSAQAKATMIRMLQFLRQRHHNQLTTGKGWARSCAKASQAASLALQQKLRNRSSAVGVVVLMSLMIGLAVMALAYNPEAQEAFHALSQTTVGQQVLDAAHSVQVQIAPYSDAVRRFGTPYLQQASARVAPALDSLKAQITPYAQQIGKYLSASLQQVKASVQSLTAPSGQVVS